MSQISNLIKEYAFSLGFSHAGVCVVEPDGKIPFLQEWLRENYHGKMKYMENARRSDPRLVMPDARSIVVVGLNYHDPKSFERPQEAVISKYAWNGDYHTIMREMLEDLRARVHQVCKDPSTRVYVDTGPVVEKHWAQKAGIGWIGKHTNIISRKGSSWLFLGVLLTNVDLPPDEPAQDHCGTCRRCIDACPTRAIVAPYVLDARLCISYLTIELRESIPVELRPLIGTRIFGCDDCQDVCPWNRFAYAGDPRFAPREEVFTTSLQDYLSMTAEEFRNKFAGTNVLRAKHRGFIRNCLVAAGNARRPELRSAVEKHLASEDEMIREHAHWALQELDRGTEEWK